ncbi:AlpA family phage regulatory protein [Pseudomonas mosselii]|uniref:helix-turn-helix transcriptional regulator n=1 Tax=Pseudomonas mosselii TaxID=78327 RepID=UPI00209C441B|nr:AlpA family phage regulatory protein [Pseudomonas mosselii]MDH1103644.1 AlpA family phage regulatory protein [Pseudomonas mosselii]MEA3237152.1 AlpA family phage regulatory protein [Pseudomonas mosselii]MEB5934323.1 AlpA family phage regulatory protein [Pseudomonas mosselii]UWS68031.1 AlpA family phage regulatory protein [Pseudomonas mosselii]
MERLLFLQARRRTLQAASSSSGCVRSRELPEWAPPTSTRRCRLGDFLGQIKLGPRAVAWIKAEVLAWAMGQVALARGAAQKPHHAHRSTE